MDALVEFLVDGSHPVTFDRYNDREDIAEALRDRVLLMRCTDTRGGTELACELKAASADEAAVAIASSATEVVGDLILNDIDLQVKVAIEPTELRGKAEFFQS